MPNELEIEPGLVIYQNDNKKWKVRAADRNLSLALETKMEAIYYASTIALGIPYSHFMSGLEYLKLKESCMSREIDYK